MKLSNYVMVFAAALGLAACATAPKEDPTLTRAQAAVQEASNDPTVAQYAPQELQRAQQELDAAQKATSPEQRDQLAYVASRHVDLARLQARDAVARAAVAQGSEERNRILIAAKTAEAQRAQQEAEIARAQATAANTEAAQAQGQAAQLQQQLQDLQAKETARGLVITLSDVLFDTGKVELKPGAGLQLDKIANFLQQHPERRVAVEGFTDSVGGEEYNQQLSERRAQAVKDALGTRGVSSERIDVRGYGKGYPVASNSEATGRQLNRRVEIVISTGANAVPPRS